MVYPGSTGVAPRAGIVLAPQFGQNTAVAGTSMRQRGQLVVDSSTSPATSLHYPSQADIELDGLATIGQICVSPCPTPMSVTSTS